MNPQLRNMVRRAQPRRQVVKAPRIFRLPRDQEDAIKRTPRVHLAGIQAGLGEENHFLTVTYRVLVAKGLAELMSAESKGYADMRIYPALSALWRVGDRYLRVGKVGVSGDDLRAIEDALDICDELQDATFRREALQVYKTTQTLVGGMDLTMRTLAPYQLT